MLSVRVLADQVPSSGGFVRCRVARSAHSPSVSFSIGVRLDGRLSRGAHKIALEYLCLLRGRVTALAPELDGLREYVLGTAPGFRHVLCCEQRLATGALVHGVQSIQDIPGRSPTVVMRLCGIPIVVSLAEDPNEILLIGREMNDLAGAPIMRTFDQRGLARLP